MVPLLTSSPLHAVYCLQFAADLGTQQTDMLQRDCKDLSWSVLRLGYSAAEFRCLHAYTGALTHLGLACTVEADSKALPACELDAQSRFENICALDSLPCLIGTASNGILCHHLS